MPTVYKILGQLLSNANTQSTVYTVPVGNSTVISTITVCNQNTANTTYRLAIQPTSGNAAANSFIIYDATVLGKDTAALTLGLTLAQNNIISANCSLSNVSINIFGSEIY